MKSFLVGRVPDTESDSSLTAKKTVCIHFIVVTALGDLIK